MPVAVRHLADDCPQHFERYQNLARDVLDRPVPAADTKIPRPSYHPRIGPVTSR